MQIAAMHSTEFDALNTELQQHYSQLHDSPMVALFAQEPARAQSLSVEAAGLLLDFSKNLCTETTLKLFERRAQLCQLPQHVEAMFHGANVNFTEHRPALHSALRAQRRDAPKHAEVLAVQRRMQDLVESIAAGTVRGFSGRAISDVINIGIGGSDLGPRFVTTALQPLHNPALRVHFVANIDPVELADTLAALDPATTLIITASKSFATLETLTNSLAARHWLQAAAAGRPIDNQLVAITANTARAVEFGIRAENIFPMWDWVGGRYSLWSAIGLPIAIAIGWHHFLALLQGAAAMDEHYRTAPTRTNMPTLLALLECWYGDFGHAHSALVLPYSHRLRLFPAFLQQLSMESLGKRVQTDGRPVRADTGLAIWGEPGTNSQHSFMQLLHQGTRTIPVDFIAVAGGEQAGTEQHAHLFASCLSQSRALLTGKTHAEALQELLSQGLSPAEAQTLAPHKVLPGNRPSNTLLLDALDPQRLGALIALYEHKVHAQSVLWNINAFDQWGVELGKQSAGGIFASLEGRDSAALDSSTEQLIHRFRSTGKPPK